MPDLTSKQALFVQEYLVDLNATQAAIRAGYSEKTARFMGAENLTKPNIQQAVRQGFRDRVRRVEVTQDYVLGMLLKNVERAMQAEPVVDRDGRPTGVYLYQGSVANKALELLGKHLGIFPERHEHEFVLRQEAERYASELGCTPEELLADVAGMKGRRN